MNSRSSRETPRVGTSRPPLLSAERLCWRFREGGEACLDLQVPPGRALRISGPSGSGKTTLLKVLARLYPARSGSLSLEGISARDLPPPQWRRKVLYVPQNPVLFEGTARENILLPWRIPSRRKEARPPAGKVEETAERLGLEPATLERRAALLSGGEGARICLGRALLSGPRILLLDEPFAFLDGGIARDTARLLSEWVQEDGRALLLVSHAEPPPDLSFQGTIEAGELLEKRRAVHR